MTKRISAHRLKKYRWEAGFTQRGAAALLGVKPTQLMEWEKGKRMPKGIHLMKLATLYQRLFEDMYYELRQDATREIRENKRIYGNFGNEKPP